MGDTYLQGRLESFYSSSLRDVGVRPKPLPPGLRTSPQLGIVKLKMIYDNISSRPLSCNVEQSLPCVMVFADLSSEERCKSLQKFMNSLSRSLELTAAAEIVCRAATLKYTN